ncbi:DEAD/DEAH box helicase family protein [Streptosporangium sandarakinum]|uniref:DEAD/DEAH box helicase family protein n=1 Tax=Streptosporangium sandarakinum TaxID=1260955 RepID=UPI0036B1FD8E
MLTQSDQLRIAEWLPLIADVTHQHLDTVTEGAARPRVAARGIILCRYRSGPEPGMMVQRGRRKRRQRGSAEGMRAMPLDWSKIGAGDQEPLLRPREIYTALTNRPWSYLRQEQGEVLEKWFARKDDRDIVIKQNTGGGKTVAGLLIAQSTLNEGIGKAVYLAPDTYLAGRVREEAARLGLATATDTDDLAFRSQQAILVTTFQKLINGKSVFGVAGDGRDQIDLGIVVVDDAHAALAATEGQFRLTIPDDHPAYKKLLKLFAADLKNQSLKVWEDIEADDYTATARIPFWSWAQQRQTVMKMLHPHRLEREFKFKWPLISEVLHLCAATVTSRSVEIRPPCPPISMIPSFANARRRVYLTATLADDSILVTDLNADPALLTRPVTPGSAADLGDRMILAPIALNRGLDDEAVRVLARQFADGDRDGDNVQDAKPINVVVLVPSTKAAEAWKPYADRTFYVGDLDAGVAALKAGHVGLVVLVNKYDGVDLPGTACELLILDGVPRPMDAVERREAIALADSPARLAREVQRIEQGMGRGVRDAKDYCAVLLLGANLGVATHDPRHLNLFSPATQAQLKLSRDIANLIQGEGLDSIRTALSACLARDPQWVERSRRALAEIRYVETSVIRPEAIALRRAFDLAAQGQSSAAADTLQEAINDLEDRAMRGWLMEQKAAYLDLTDPAAAQQLLVAAGRENSFVLRPTTGVAPAQIKAAAVQAREAAIFLAHEYKDAMNLVLGMRKLLEKIVWDEERTDDAEAAWEQLGRHLGLTSTRPEKLYGTGPDNLWALSAKRHAVVELKTGCTAATIAKKDLDQLGGSVRWDQEHHPEVTPLPVMIHPTGVLDDRGIVVPNMRVVTPEKLEKLKGAVLAYAVALADGQGRWGDEQAVAMRLAHGKLNAGNIFQIYAEAPRSAAASR